MKTNLAILGLALIMLSFAVLGAFAIYFRLIIVPKILASLSKSMKWLVKIDELTWKPVEFGSEDADGKWGGRFARAIFSWSGHHLSPTELDPNATIEIGDPVAPTVVSPPTGSWRHKIAVWFERWIRAWLFKQGFEWLGFAAPHTIRIGSIEITAVSMVENPSPDVPLEKWVQSVKRRIFWLRTRFPRPILSLNVETSDGFKIKWLILCQVKVVVPYRTWYELGGKAYDTMDKSIQATWRAFAQHVKLDDLYKERRKELEETLLGNFAPDTSTGICKNLDFTNTLGVVVTKVELVEWEDDAGNKFRNAIQEPTVQMRLREAQMTIMKTRGIVAAQEARALKVEEKRNKQLAVTNEEREKALTKLAGTNKELKEQFLARDGLGSADYATYRKTRAVEKTGIKAVFGSLGDLFGQTPKEKPATESTPPEEKPKKDEKKSEEKK